MNRYIGHEAQLYGVEEYRLVGGKGDGMRMLRAYNGLGLEFVVSLDRNADIPRLSYRGVNMSYMSPCGYVAPAYYDDRGANFLKSFTAGFLTTCGLCAVGSPCVDEGEELPLHGTVANIPTEHSCWYKEGDELVIRAETHDERIFARKLRLIREIRLSLTANEFTFKDTVENRGVTREPVEILYHMNMGYPLLDEDSVVKVSSHNVRARNAHAAEDIANWMNMEKPQPDYEERCYYHDCKGDSRASIFQPKLGVGLEMSFNADSLDCFTEWKMMGVRDYVLGLEPGNCYPDGRDVMRKEGLLKFLAPDDSVQYAVKLRFFDKE